MEPMNMQAPVSQKNNGPVVGIIVVIIVLAVGAYYLFTQLQAQQEANQTDEAAVETIEGDLQEEDLAGLEAEMEADLQELEQTQ